MSDNIFLWEFREKDPDINPLNNPDYLRILWFSPTLLNELKKRILALLDQKYNVLQKSSLNPNLLVKKDLLDRAKRDLVIELYELEKLTWDSKNINIIWDECFTNKLLLNLILKILGEENFERFVSVKNIDLSKPYDDDKFSVNPNSLIIFWWSLHDTYNIDESYYNWFFAEIIKMLADDFDLPGLNNRVIWVCFWQQYLANLLWIKNNHSSSIVATYKWLAQFWPSNCLLENYKFVSRVYQEALFWLSDFWLNNEFSTFFTRTWYVDFDLLKTGYSDLIVPLIKDEITWSTVWWWTKNGNILWVQFHPEISYFEDRWFLRDNIESIIPYLSQYNNPERLIENFNFDSWFWNINKDIWEYFYTFSMLAFIKSIKDKYIRLYRTDLRYSQVEKLTDYRETLNKLTKVVREKIDSILAISNPLLNDTKERLNFLKRIDESWRLLLNSRLDWKVNRWIWEISKILWFYDLWELLEDHIEFLKTNSFWNNVYIFRDWWAWDGSLLKELYSKYKKKDILFYWVWDYIYFDIYPSLKSKWLEMWIPEDVIVLLFEEFLENYLKFEDGNIFLKVRNALEKTNLEHIHKIHHSSITSSDTLMYSPEWEYDISKESVGYIRQNHTNIEKLKKYIIDNFYSLFEWYFERIYVSKFNDFNLEDVSISKVDFQVAIRSTSHIDSREYMKVIFDYITLSANNWSVYIDNWVHRSYTWVPRLYELLNVSKMGINTKFSLIYDENTNYFTSVVIQKSPYHNDEFFTSKLKPWYKVVSLEEACNSTFFKLEYFIRNFIIRNFKNYNVFWDFNKEIIWVLVELIDCLKNWNLDKIKNIILDLINYIATNYKNGNIVYDKIDMNILENYSTWLGESLDQIISKEIYIPNWMNLDAKRNY